MTGAPFDMVAYFDARGDEEEDLEVVEVATDDGKWIDCEPFFPDATLLVVLWQRGARRIAVRYEERVTEFDLYHMILRDDSLVGVDRPAHEEATDGA